MRTTLNIDDDLLREVRARAHKTRTPVRKIVNAALRKGLTGSQPRHPKKAYRCPTFDMGRPLVNMDKALAIAASLEDSEVLRELEMKK
jgi:hypothetical protein